MLGLMSCKLKFLEYCTRAPTNSGGQFRCSMRLYVIAQKLSDTSASGRSMSITVVTRSGVRVGRRETDREGPPLVRRELVMVDHTVTILL